MKERDIKTGENILVLGAGQLGAAVLEYLVPAVTSATALSPLSFRPAPGTAGASFSPKRIKNWLMQGQNLSRSMSPTVPLKR